jgi:hypothetical protein
MLRIEQTLNKRVDAVEHKIVDISNQVKENKTELEQARAGMEYISKEANHIKNDLIPKVYYHTNTTSAKLHQEMLLREIHDRKQNLLFYGVPQKTPQENTYDIIRESFVTDFGMNEEQARETYIVNAHRLPRRNHATDGSLLGNKRGPDPIIVRFGCMADRDYILDFCQKRAFSPDKKPIMVYTDLTAELKRVRGQLAGEAKRLRSEGMQTRIRVADTRVILEYKPRGRKDVPWKQFFP